VNYSFSTGLMFVSDDSVSSITNVLNNHSGQIVYCFSRPQLGLIGIEEVENLPFKPYIENWNYLQASGKGARPEGQFQPANGNRSGVQDRIKRHIFPVLKASPHIKRGFIR
jgi:hypothetical protein